jgi:hypothetical protein
VPILPARICKEHNRDPNKRNGRRWDFGIAQHFQ